MLSPFAAPQVDPAAGPSDARPRGAVRVRRGLPIHEVSGGMILRRVRVGAPDVVFVKGVLEASEGLAALFAERGGELSIAAPCGRARELAELLADLERELGAAVIEEAGDG